MALQSRRCAARSAEFNSRRHLEVALPDPRFAQRRGWRPVAGRLIMAACGDAAMRDWLLVLVPFGFAVS